MPSRWRRLFPSHTVPMVPSNPPPLRAPAGKRKTDDRPDDKQPLSHRSPEPHRPHGGIAADHTDGDPACRAGTRQGNRGGQQTTNRASLACRFVWTHAALACVPLAKAGPYEDGVAAHKKGQLGQAERLWLPLARNGDPAAQASLGRLYSKPLKRLRTDHAAAARGFRLAADQGFAPALYGLADGYGNGDGVPLSADQAPHGYGQSAPQGNLSAQQTDAAHRARARAGQGRVADAAGRAAGQP